MKNFDITNLRDYFKDSFALEQFAELIRIAVAKDDICLIQFDGKTLGGVLSIEQAKKLRSECEENNEQSTM
jgi:hypothetical protein